MKHKTLALSMTLLMGLTLSACGTAAAHHKSLNVTLPDEPATVDPNTAYDTNSASLISQTMEGLYKYNGKNQLVAGVATKVVKPTNGGKTYTFTLRKDAEWSNGKPVTANDFVTSFRRTVDPKTKAQFASVYDSFKNFAAVQAGKLSPNKLGVKALNTHKLQIQLSRPVPYFNGLVATKFLPINTAAVKKYGKKFGTNAESSVYNGPYKLVGWTGSNSAWHYVKNPYYYNAKNVKIAKVNVSVAKNQNTAVNLFKGGKVDVTTVTGQYVRQNKNDDEMHTHLTGRVNYLYFNNKRKKTNSENLRKAMSMVINRKTLTDSVLQDGSKPMLSAVPLNDQKDPANGKDMAQQVGNLLSYNVDQAKKYWQAYLKETGQKNVTLNLLTDDSDQDKHTGEYLQSAAQKAFKGLEVTVTSIPHAQHVARDFAGTFDMNLTGWSTNWLDSSDFLGLAASSNQVNFTHLKDAKLDSLLNESNSLTGQARYDKLVAADKQLVNNMDYVPLYQPATANLINKKLSGLKFSLIQDAQYQYAYWK
ncbi:ABC transporter substrate-binding protein [Lentilactobacillus parakefiri]|uniref:peptide ABC transporter substrate-binding protein n=1 Tax=Lentilactobacillus parakefiri TaxID=152332 RepID=UPI000BA52C21|nr:peptide ABC transporter substrate-binding protein [Lentilactobacillus parakefiri]PAL01524.1 ABC transporter substrate-binding protein [Lentilactobacillus parakefiri]